MKGFNLSKKEARQKKKKVDFKERNKKEDIKKEKHSTQAEKSKTRRSKGSKNKMRFLVGLNLTPDDLGGENPASRFRQMAEELWSI